MTARHRVAGAKPAQAGTHAGPPRGKYYSEGTRRFGNVLTERGLSARQAAKELGTSKTSVIRIKNGERKPQLDLAKEIKRQYGIDDELWLQIARERVLRRSPNAAA